MKKKYVVQQPDATVKRLCEMFGIEAGNVTALDIRCRPGELPVATAMLGAVESVEQFNLDAVCKKALETCESHTKYGALLRIAETKAAFKATRFDMKARHKQEVYKAWLNNLASHE